MSYFFSDKQRRENQELKEKVYPVTQRKQLGIDTKSINGKESSSRYMVSPGDDVVEFSVDQTESRAILVSSSSSRLILRANPYCISNFEKRISMQLDQATLEDLLMPNF
ncbi:hypothetical protein TB2_007577 [Malus domestica]